MKRIYSCTKGTKHLLQTESIILKPMRRESLQISSIKTLQLPLKVSVIKCVSVNMKNKYYTGYTIDFDATQYIRKLFLMQ